MGRGCGWLAKPVGITGGSGSTRRGARPYAPLPTIRSLALGRLRWYITAVCSPSAGPDRHGAVTRTPGPLDALPRPLAERERQAGRGRRRRRSALAVVMAGGVAAGGGLAVPPPPPGPGGPPPAPAGGGAPPPTAPPPGP